MGEIGGLRLDENGVATAGLNPGEVLDYVADYVPLVGLRAVPDGGGGAYIVTVLKAGVAGDVAAYRAAALDTGAATLAAVAAHGQKVTEARARAVWGDHLDRFGDYRR